MVKFRTTTISFRANSRAHRREFGLMHRESATDRVFAHLREQITAGHMAAGSMHSIYRLAQELGVSRTPVRDAVLRLADAGLVTIERNRGVRVRGVNCADVRAAFELRLMLEVPAAALAAERASREQVSALQETYQRMLSSARAHNEQGFLELDGALHAQIAGVMDNQRLVQQLQAVSDSIQGRGALTIERSRSIVDVALEHGPIVEAVGARDARAAAEHMRDHLVATATLLMQQVAETDPEADADVVAMQWARDLSAYLPGITDLPNSPSQ
jgi:DNA-binding GntR family transcriptional regulator